MKKHLTRKWAFGNKRQKKKVQALNESCCGCHHCCPEDRREKLRFDEVQDWEEMDTACLM